MFKSKLFFRLVYHIILFFGNLDAYRLSFNHTLLTPQNTMAGYFIPPFFGDIFSAKPAGSVRPPPQQDGGKSSRTMTFTIDPPSLVSTR